jgi:hypothetical protein
MDSPMNETGMETQKEVTPFDSLINQVKNYAENPSLVTRETLTDLLTQLTEMKSVVDEEEPEEFGAETQPELPMGKPSLSGAISKKMNPKEEEEY